MFVWTFINLIHQGVLYPHSEGIKQAKSTSDVSNDLHNSNRD